MPHVRDQRLKYPSNVAPQLLHEARGQEAEQKAAQARENAVAEGKHLWAEAYQAMLEKAQPTPVGKHQAISKPMHVPHSAASRPLTARSFTLPWNVASGSWFAIAKMEADT